MAMTQAELHLARYPGLHAAQIARLSIRRKYGSRYNDSTHMSHRLVSSSLFPSFFGRGGHDVTGWVCLATARIEKKVSWGTPNNDRKCHRAPAIASTPADPHNMTISPAIQTLNTIITIVSYFAAGESPPCIQDNANGRGILMKMTLVLLLLITGVLIAHGGHASKHQRWDFWPQYELPGSARNYPGPRTAVVTSPIDLFAARPASMAIRGRQATAYVTNLLRPAQLPTTSFSVEMLTVDHVNRPVGAFVAVTEGIAATPKWLLGFYDNTIYFGPVTNGQTAAITLQKGHKSHGIKVPGLTSVKEYWNHLVGVYQNGVFTLYNNGAEVARAPAEAFTYSSDARLEVSAFLDNEPYMDLGNAVRFVELHHEALSPADIKEAFEREYSLLEKGQIFADFFHYTAGPYLSTPATDGISLLWETDRPARAKVFWGRELPYSDSLEITPAARIHKARLTGLKPDFAYFYNVRSIAADKTTIESGNLTFRTASGAGEPLSFAVVGDTEARPFVNDRLAKLIWEERPDFLVLVGDLTDGGQKNHRWQWTHEYFLGMNQLTSRIPVVPAPGNGEGDRVWYDHYHHLPDDSKPYYAYRYGDAEFFMLDTNMGHRERSDKAFRQKQRDWLDSALATSEARWKIAGHHHPTYSSDENDYGDTMKEQSANGDLNVRNDFVDIYEKHSVDVVFFGHLHSYERTHGIKDGIVNHRQGVVYVQTGGGGGNHENASPTRNWFTRKVFSNYHYTMVNIEADVMTITVVDAEGRMRDQFTINKLHSGNL
jgi:hypothetical protein